MSEELKGKELGRVGGKFLTYLSTGLWFGPITDAALLFSLVWTFHLLSWQLSTVYHWSECHLANVLQWVYNEALGLLDVLSSSSWVYLVLASSFFFFLPDSSRNLDKCNWFLFKAGAGVWFRGNSLGTNIKKAPMVWIVTHCPLAQNHYPVIEI